MTIYAGTSGEQMPELARITIDEMRRAADEHERSRGRARPRPDARGGFSWGSKARRTAPSGWRAWSRSGGSVPTPEQVVEKIDAVNRTAVRDFAGRMIGEAGAVMALYGPVSDAPDLAALDRQRRAA